jgi:hypothetical protein
MLCETLLRIPFSVIGRCSSLAEWERHQIQLSQTASGIVLQDHIRPSCMHFQGQNRRFRVSEEDYYKLF